MFGLEKLFNRDGQKDKERRAHRKAKLVKQEIRKGRCECLTERDVDRWYERETAGDDK